MIENLSDSVYKVSLCEIKKCHPGQPKAEPGSHESNNIFIAFPLSRG